MSLDTAANPPPVCPECGRSDHPIVRCFACGKAWHHCSCNKTPDHIFRGIQAMRGPTLLDQLKEATGVHDETELKKLFPIRREYGIRRAQARHHDDLLEGNDDVEERNNRRAEEMP